MVQELGGDVPGYLVAARSVILSCSAVAVGAQLRVRCHLTSRGLPASGVTAGPRVARWSQGVKSSQMSV